MISLGMAGYSPNSAHLWKSTCASMKKDVHMFIIIIYFIMCNVFQQIKHPYLRAAFSFLSSEDPLLNVLVCVCYNVMLLSLARPSLLTSP